MSAQHYLSYTYFLKWTILNKKYYGSRIANEVEPRKDLWVNYFGSSDYVDRLVNLFGKPDVVLVDKTFTCEKECHLYEIQVLKENDVVNDPTWLNQHIPGEDFTMSGREHTIGTRQKMSKKKKGKKFTKEHRKNLSIANKGKTKFQTQETRIKISNTLKANHPNRKEIILENKNFVL